MRPHVLLVDDDAAARTALTKLLWQFEYLCTAVASYEEARSVLREYTPDLLITDVRLGTHNGLHLIVNSPKVPAIVITGFDDPMLRKEAERMGASTWLSRCPLGTCWTSLRSGFRSAHSATGVRRLIAPVARGARRSGSRRDIHPAEFEIALKDFRRPFGR